MPFLDTGLRALMAALDRSRARIEFTPDGTVLTANTLFLGLMGYTLTEVTGQPHARFVSATEQGSEAYRAFWDALRRASRRHGSSGGSRRMAERSGYRPPTTPSSIEAVA